MCSKPIIHVKHTVSCSFWKTQILWTKFSHFNTGVMLYFSFYATLFSKHNLKVVVEIKVVELIHQAILCPSYNWFLYIFYNTFTKNFVSVIIKPISSEVKSFMDVSLHISLIRIIFPFRYPMKNLYHSSEHLNFSDTTVVDWA